MKFYGLWSPKGDNKKIEDCLKTGIWYRGDCPDEQGEREKFNELEFGDDVFLYNAINDVELINSPLAQFLPAEKYDLAHKVVQAKCYSIGKITAINFANLSVSVDWDLNYSSVEWFVYFRQDGVWKVHNNKSIANELERIIFKQQKQNYSILIDKYKKQNENTMIIGIHQKALKYYLTYREHTNRTFYLRARNTKKKLERGYWFQGNEGYVFTSPFKPADNHNKTQRIGFVILSNKSCYFEFAYEAFSQEDKKYEGFYKEVLDYYEVSYSNLNDNHIKKINLEQSQNWGTELEKFLYTYNVPKMIEIAKKHNVPDDYLFFSEEEFNKRLTRVLSYQEKINNLYKPKANNDMKTPLNQILYGPPGTGKTYSTVNYALEILEATDEQKQSIKSIGKLKEEFKSQVEFVTFHQSFSYEDFVEGIKAEDNGERLTYEPQPGIFKRICKNANAAELVAVKVANIKFADYLEVGQEFETLTGRRVFKIEGIDENNNITIVNSQNNPYRLQKSKIFEYLLSLDFYNTQGHHSYEPVIAKYIDSEIIRELNSNRKPYILIIDEINRGNISRIFGELITLIEPSKRAGAEEEISVKLPYSKEDFSVPNNLHIIGTMNTADRSLTLIDTALRRRFDFVEMLPDVSLVTDDCDGINLRKILENINQRIEVLYDREHTIGHSFLINVDSLEALQNTFKNKILPLLEEYFYDDWQKIKAVLADKNDSFYKQVKQDENLFVGMEVDYNQEQKIYNRQNCGELEAKDFIQIYQIETNTKED